jgi:unsaturated rhamnogalacturonyl hydrolase
MRKVADWQLERARPYFSTDWTFAALYDGFMAASATLGDAKYEQAMREMGEKLNWQLGPRPEHADDVAVGQVYLELYLKQKDARILPPLTERFAYQMGLKDDPAKPLWWWCDALFMGRPRWRASTKPPEKPNTSISWIANGGSRPSCYTIPKSTYISATPVI